MTNSLVKLLAKTETTSDGCLVFTGTRIPKNSGYGRMQIQGIRKLTHVWVWEEHNGPVPPGIRVLHHCDNPPCCLLKHLYAGTDQDNVDDRKRRGRSARLCGAKHSQALFTARQVARIRARYAAGERQADIAVRYNVGRWIINDIVHEKTYKEEL